MKILPDPIEFEWDNGNQDKNFKKHTVTNKEAEEIFESKGKFLHKDVKHSAIEVRYMIWGSTKNNRMLAVFFTMRENKIRIISARYMSKKERNNYEKKIQNSPKI